MTRRLITLLAFLGAVTAVTGCQGSRNLEQELINVQNTSKAQVDLIKKQNEHLNRKLNDMREEVIKLQEQNDRLSTELAEYVNRPEEVKLEIISEVNTRFNALSASQKEFQNSIVENFETKAAEIEAGLDTDVEGMTETLSQHISFVQFVATEQDSINRVFANRFDSRPWYQSVLGKWDDMERSKQQAAP